MSQKDYLPGDVIIFKCHPLIKISSKIPGVNSICESCFGSPEDNSTISLTPCSGCSLVSYCSTACKSRDWKAGHKIECGSKTFANNFNQSHSEYKINTRCQIFRAMAFFVMNPEAREKRYELYNGKSRCFNDLMSHEDYFDLANTNTAAGQMKIICEELAHEISAEELAFNGKRLEIDSKYLLRLGGIFKTNSFAMTNDEETSESGSGIFIEASIFDHSCKPTAMFHSRNSGLEIRAIAPISKGEEPFISYISAHMAKKERQEFLRERYNFDCLCDRCASPLDESTGINLLNRLINFYTTNQDISSNDILRIHEGLIKTMEQIYHKFDPRITIQYIRTLNLLLSNAKFKTLEEEKLKKVIQDTKERVNITYGANHPEYLKLDQGIYDE